MLPEKTTDRRIIKSHRDIRAALVDLLHEKPYENITVQEILNRALINRNTFYKYYSGKSALAGAMIADFKRQYADLVRQRFSGHADLSTLLQLAPELFSQRKLLLALWKIESKRHHLYADMFALIKQGFWQQMQQKNPQYQSDNAGYQAELYATLALTSVRYYFERDLPLPVAQLSTIWREMIDVADVQAA
ncbi:TetR family transcriptional regulator [Neisseria chenwenguii]|uniref:AcrR family transcriptional regulator n=1 Tax=Neisseria chenwenguii TaxID=1853278 RepID=A0A220S1K5_9NEIS|nr:TetR family transcriptional regulator [Neisseria chenwenguii]ASK27390.1 AcrR family transcriptional regulator [Neisseria chenwenguii]ROV56938.1 TetR/AcrR family transcriptional regulator [Neisseria chenwenguii]